MQAWRDFIGLIDLYVVRLIKHHVEHDVWALKEHAYYWPTVMRVDRAYIKRMGTHLYLDRTSNSKRNRKINTDTRRIIHCLYTVDRSLCRQSHSAITTTWSHRLVCRGTIDSVISVGGMLHSSTPGSAEACKMYVRTWRCVNTVRDRQLELMSPLSATNLRT